MTTTFDSRERGYENKHAHDQEVEFKIAAHVHHLIGLWAAEEMQLNKADAEKYAQSMAELGVGQQPQLRIKEQLQKDFSAAGVEIDVEAIGKKMQELMQAAKSNK
jgi:hypothetical protein